MRLIPLVPTGPILPVVVAACTVAAALTGVGVAGYQASQRQLLAVVSAQALSLRETVLAAARTNAAAASEAERQLGQRLLDNARLLDTLDRRSDLTPALLDEVVRRQGLFRAALYDAAGRRVATAGGPGGQGFGGGQLLDRLVTGQDTEAVTDVHRSRWGDPRVAAGVRRKDGGAILLNADATAVDALQRPYSLDTLLSSIATGNPGVAYIALQDGDTRIVHGDALAAAALPALDAGAADDTGERQFLLGGRPVLEVSGPARLHDDSQATLRLGMRLDDIRTAGRQLIVRLALSLAGTLALTIAALGFVGLRQRYGELSVKHARAEEALRRRDRLAAMGELASTVAHEVRNPLNAIAMSAQRLRREWVPATTTGDHGESAELVGVIESEARRLDQTVQQFLQYARPPKLARRQADLDALLQEAVEPVRAMAELRGISLSLTGHGGSAEVDRDQLRQVLDNLLRNAIDATPTGGLVTVTAGTSGGEVTIEVRDTGSGILPEHLPRIFDLYFTTKADGTGVGLAVTHQIVSAHGGTIDVESLPGAGTRMTVRLPAREDAHG